MRLILKVIIVFVVVALLLLVVLAWLENRENNSPSAILDDLKDAGKDAIEDVDDFLHSSGIKQGAADLLDKGADLLKPSPEQSPLQTTPEPVPGQTPALQ